jgi:hypothetical protein
MNNKIIHYKKEKWENDDSSYFYEHDLALPVGSWSYLLLWSTSREPGVATLVFKTGVRPYFI